MGTPLRDVIDLVGGGARPGRRIVAVISGVANAVLGAEQLGTPLSYEAMTAIGSGLGAAGFIVFDDTTDLVAVAAGVARFLAVESCGQCARCKQDGLGISDRLRQITRSAAPLEALDEVQALLRTVAEGARCNLASQQQTVVGSILTVFPDPVDAHLTQRVPPREPELIAAILDLEHDQVVLDEHQVEKQPDWTYEPEDSGQWPADRLDDHRNPQPL